MPSIIESLIAMAILGAFLSFGVFGLLSWLNVDQEKSKSVTGKILRWGPFVSESILNEKGRRYARIRNICFICVWGLAVGFAAAMTIIKK
jgi:hypothetical protein